MMCLVLSSISDGINDCLSLGFAGDFNLTIPRWTDMG